MCSLAQHGPAQQSSRERTLLLVLLVACNLTLGCASVNANQVARPDAGILALSLACMSQHTRITDWSCRKGSDIVPRLTGRQCRPGNAAVVREVLCVRGARVQHSNMAG